MTGRGTVAQEADRSGDGGVPLQRSLPGRSYTSEAEFARERDQVLLPGWFCVGRADGLTEPGCYLAADVCGESVIVTRTEDGGLAGYYNLCRHRGSRLVPRPLGCDPAAGPPTSGDSLAGPPPGGQPAAGPPPGAQPAAGPLGGQPAAGPLPGAQPAAGPPPGAQPAAGPLGGQPAAGPLPGAQPAAGPPPGAQPVGGPLTGGPVASGRFPGAVRCPYHAWTYGLDGTLRAAPFLPGLRKHRAALSLHRVDVATWGGFVFARLEPPAAPGPADSLEATLGEIPARVAAYPLAGLRTGARLRYDVAANWKVILENYNECYHCGPVHPELCELVPAFRRGGGDLDWAAGIPHRSGATTFTSTGTTRRAPFPGLSEAERTRHFGELVLPNLMLSLSADHVATFTLWPRSAGQTTVLCDFLFHPAELARPDFNPSDAAGFWDLVNRQDWSICEQVQDGMGSRRFSVGYLAPMEQPSADIGRYVAARLDASGPPGEPGS
jgi:glycine betaine catabolism A